MASTYSDRLKLELMEAGANSGVWGNNTNENLEIIDAAIGGYLSKSVAGSSNVTLTTADRDPNVETTNESANRVIDLNGTLTGNIYVFVPALEKEYTIFNNTSGAYTVTVAATGHSANGVTVTQGTYSHLYCDGSANYNVKNSVSTLGATEFKANVSLGDSNRLLVGTGNDLQIYHDGSDSWIYENGTGDFKLATNGPVIRLQKGATEIMADFNPDGAVDLYYDNNKKLETTATGIAVTGGATFTANVSLGDGDYINFGASDDMYIGHTGTASLIRDNGTGDLFIDSVNLQFRNATASETYATFTENGSVDLYYDNNKKFETTTNGIDVTGQVLADKAYIAEATLTDGATINWDMSTQSVAKVTLGGNRTLAAPTNGSTGQFASLLVIQDGTGSRTLTFNAAYEFKDDTAPTLTTTGGKGDLFVFRYNGTKWLEVGRNLNLTLS